MYSSLLSLLLSNVYISLVLPIVQLRAITAFYALQQSSHLPRLITMYICNHTGGLLFFGVSFLA